MSLYCEKRKIGPSAALALKQSNPLPILRRVTSSGAADRCRDLTCSVTFGAGFPVYFSSPLALAADILAGACGVRRDLFRVVIAHRRAPSPIRLPALPHSTGDEVTQVRQNGATTLITIALGWSRRAACSGPSQLGMKECPEEAQPDEIGAKLQQPDVMASIGRGGGGMPRGERRLTNQCGSQHIRLPRRTHAAPSAE